MLRIYQAATALVIAASFALPACAKASIMQFGFDATLQTGALAGTERSAARQATTTRDRPGVGHGVPLPDGHQLLPRREICFILSARYRSGRDRPSLENGALSYFTAAFFPGLPNPVDDIRSGIRWAGDYWLFDGPRIQLWSGVLMVLLAPVPEPPALSPGQHSIAGVFLRIEPTLASEIRIAKMTGMFCALSSHLGNSCRRPM